MCIALYITEIQILSTQKSELPSPPCVRPRITITWPHTVQNLEREGSPTMESMQQALSSTNSTFQADVKDDSYVLILISKKNLNN